MSGRRHDNRGAAPYPRSLRVNQVLRQVVAEELERLADADERLRLVTVTSVDTAPDLRHATVYLSSLSEDAADALAERRAQLQQAVARQTRMKRTPLLEFSADPAVIAGGRVEEVLRRIRGEESGTHEGTGAGGPDEPGRSRRRTRRPTMSPAGADPVTGLVVVDKEAGWTSHDVVARCRRIFGQRRVGHAGTLDPDATGVLLVGLGRATRLMRFLTALPKTYEAEVVLGTATSTLDASGEVTGRWDMDGITLAEVRAAAVSLTGPIEQVPPMVSAVKVGGQRLHTLARAGVEVERAARPVTVYRFDVQPGLTPGVFRIEVECSSGTYVRVLAADLGTALGGGAHLRNLRRTRIGSFSTEEARPVDELTPALVLTPAQALRDLDQVVVPAAVQTPVARGLALDRVPLGITGDGPWGLVDESHRLLAVYEATGTDRIKPAVVLEAAG